MLQIRILLLLMIASAFWTVPVRAETLKDKDYVYVPVLLATDRKIHPDPTGLDYIGTQMPDGLNYAVKTIVVHPPKNYSYDAQVAQQLGWSIRKDKKDGDQFLKVENVTLTQDEFFSRAADYQAKSPSNKILVFIHGCCTNHKDAMEGAAAAALWYKVPVIAYDWTSPPWNWKAAFLTKADYLKNENNNSITSPRFTDLMNSLETHVDCKAVSFLAHSMGNRLLDQYLVDRYYKFASNPAHDKLDTADFANADVPVVRLSGDLQKIAFSMSRPRVYVDDSDPALEASRVVHSDFRAGAPRSNLNLLLNGALTDVVDHRKVTGASHDLPIWLTSDMYQHGTIADRARCRCSLSTIKNRYYTVVRN